MNGVAATSRRRAPGPATTRLLAIGLPASAVMIGAGVDRSRTARAVVAALIAVVATSGAAVAVAGRSRTGVLRGRVAPGCPMIARVTVLIPARDEARVIAGILGDLAVQDSVGAAPGSTIRGRPADRRPLDVEIIVVDDRSCDDTGAAARVAIQRCGLADRATVVRRDGGADGKGAALASVHLPRGADTAVVVLDADARVDATFIAGCVAALECGDGIATARRRMLRPEAAGRVARLLTVMQDDEQLADDFVQRARRRMGGASELRGDGMVARADVLGALGGWPEALTEDLDLSARAYLLTGRGADRFPWLEVWEQPVVSVRGLLRQRVRWAEGLVRRDLAIVLPAQLDPEIPLRRRLDSVAYAFHALAPWAAAGLLLRASTPGGGRARRLAAGLGLAYAGTGVVVAGIALGDRAGSHRAAAGRIAGVLTLESWWILALPVAWVRTARWPAHPRFARTGHLPSAAFTRSDPRNDTRRPAAIACPDDARG